jgi:hypothetical protein
MTLRARAEVTEMFEKRRRKNCISDVFCVFPQCHILTFDKIKDIHKRIAAFITFNNVIVRKIKEIK